MKHSLFTPLNFRLAMLAETRKNRQGLIYNSHSARMPFICDNDEQYFKQFPGAEIKPGFLFCSFHVNDWENYTPCDVKMYSVCTPCCNMHYTYNLLILILLNIKFTMVLYGSSLGATFF